MPTSACNIVHSCRNKDVYKDKLARTAVCEIVTYVEGILEW